MNSLIRTLLTLTLLLGMLPMTVSAEDAPLLVHYDRTADTVSLAETNTSLATLLRKISAQSGVEIRLDPEVDQQIQAGFDSKPVADALTGIAKQYRLNYILGYARDQEGLDQLVSFYVLREGQLSAADLPPLIDPQAEAVSQMLDADKYDNHKMTRTFQRWDARFERLPDSMRDKLEEAAQRSIARARTSEARRELKKAESAARREEKTARREKAEASLKEANPAAYERRQLQQAAIKEQAIADAERRKAELEASAQ